MAKALSLGDFKRNNFLVTIVVLVCVVALLFLPDMFGLSTNTSSIDTDISLNIASMWEEGQGELPEQEQVYAKEEVQNTETENVEITVESDADTSAVQPEVTWASIKGRPSRRMMQSIRGKVISFADSLPLELGRSRFALYDYAAALDFVLQSAEERMAPYEAIAYLEQRDIAVTNLLRQEGAEREVLRNWSSITLSPVVGNQVADDLKKSIVPPFKPRIYFKEVTLQRFPKGPNPYALRKGEFAVWLKLYYKGSDVRTVAVLHNGKHIRRLLPQRIEGEGGWYEASMPRLKNGLVSFVFTSKDGRRFVSHYKFQGRMPQLDWQLSVQDDAEIARHRYKGAASAQVFEASLRYRSGQINRFGNLFSATAQGDGFGNLLGKTTPTTSPYSVF